jgi:hypothetical protein
MAAESGEKTRNKLSAFGIDAGDGSIALIECPDRSSAGGGEARIPADWSLRDDLVGGRVHLAQETLFGSVRMIALSDCGVQMGNPFAVN